MAASFSVTMKCSVCGKGEVTITNTTQAADGTWGGKEERGKCPYCGAPFHFAFKSIALEHSAGLVGGETTITHTITDPATIASAAA